MPELQHLSVTDGASAVLEAVDQDGACIVDHFIEESLCDQLMQDFMPHITGVDWCNMEVEDSEFAGLLFETKNK